MKNRIKLLLIALLLLGQVAICHYYRSFRFNVDLTYLLIVYVAVRSGFLRVMATTTVLGLLLDFLSGGVLGVFAFARTLTTYFLMQVSRYIDFRKNVFIFCLIAISLFLSNAVANLFLHLAFQFRLAFPLLVSQPLLTAAVGTLICASARVKRLLDVY